MQNKRKNPSVYMACLTPEKGFTFITTVIMMAVLVMTLPFLSYTVKTFQPDSSYDELSVNEFFRFVRDELIQSYSYSITENKLYLLQEDNRMATISKYGDQIRRQVDNLGHEIYLQNVMELLFFDDDYGIRIIVTDKKGNKYEKTFVFYN